MTQNSPLLTLVLATNNRGKLAELKRLLVSLPFDVVSPSDVLGESLAINETGITFRENALLKATLTCKKTGLVSLADDSGLEVDALGGRPGVRSARFAHEHATDAENNARLLQELEEVEEQERGARFRCVLALASPFESEPRWTEGVCEGAIARSPRGQGGFGYDPLFLVSAVQGRTMAELSGEEKNAVSHRGHALRAMVAELEALLGRMTA